MTNLEVIEFDGGVRECSHRECLLKGKIKYRHCWVTTKKKTKKSSQLKKLPCGQAKLAERRRQKTGEVVLIGAGLPTPMNTDMFVEIQMYHIKRHYKKGSPGATLLTTLIRH